MSYHDFIRALMPDEREAFAEFADLVECYDDNYECGDITE